MPDIQRVAVLGCGLMGSGIAEVSARSEHDTRVREVDEDRCDAGRARISKSLGRAVDKGKLDAAERDAALGRIEFTTSLDDLSDVDLVIEAIVEDIDAKRKVFGRLDDICPPNTIFASNTSSLPIARIAAATNRPDRVVGLHFFNPVPVMKLVEVVRTIATSDAAHETALDFARAIGKEPVEASDNSGFIVNRLLVPYMLDAIRALEEGVGSIPDIDKAMVLGTGYPMGPFTLGDFVGLDTLLLIAEIMWDEYHETRFAPPALLKRMITMGYYGRKAGLGFYDYSGDEPVPMGLGQ